MIARQRYSPRIIPKLPGRRIAIGDIHGCYHTFKKLLETLDIQEEDQIFLLGDYINRGPDSAKVLDYLIELYQANPNIFPLRGNHEQKFLIASQQDLCFLEDFLSEYNSLDLLNHHLSDYLVFCDQLAYCLITENQFLSHCGISKDIKTPLNDVRTMFSHIEIVIEDQVLTSYDMIYGHSVCSISEVEHKIQEDQLNLCIDTGCVYRDIDELGYLCALDLDSREIYLQKNIES